MLDLSCCPLRRTGVIYNHIGAAALQVQRFLGRLPGRKLLLVPSPPQGPRQRTSAGASTNTSFSHSLSHPASKINGASSTAILTPPASIAAACCLQKSADFRMGQPFQVFPLWGTGGRRGKDDGFQPRCGPRVRRDRRPPPPTASARPPRRAPAAAPRGPRGRRPTRRRRVAPTRCATVLLPLATPPSKPMMRNTLLRFPLADPGRVNDRVTNRQGHRRKPEEYLGGRSPSVFCALTQHRRARRRRDAQIKKIPTTFPIYEPFRRLVIQSRSRKFLRIRPVRAGLQIDLQGDPQRGGASHLLAHQRSQPREFLGGDLEDQLIVNLQKHPRREPLAPQPRGGWRSSPA